MKQSEIEPKLPGPSSPPFWERTWFIELCSSVVPILGALAAAYVQFFPKQPDAPKKVAGAAANAASQSQALPPVTGNPILGWASLVAVVFLGVGWLLRVNKAKKSNADGIQMPLDLSAFVQTLHAVALEVGAPDSDDVWKLRVTIYRPDPKKKDELQRCVPYAGGDEDGVGRTFKNNCGVIGKAYQSRKVTLAKRENDDFNMFVEEMIENYGIPREDAKTLRPDRMAWLAIPLIGEKEPVGVVFMDSNDKEFFSTEVVDLAVAATEGIAGYVRKIYRTGGDKK